MKVKILSEAKQDIFKAASFYEKQAPNLGDYFFDSIMSEIESLSIYAGYHFNTNGYYKMLAKRFPYAVYYKYNKSQITIYAILDCRNDPKKHDIRLK